MKRNRREDENLEFDADGGLPDWSTAIFGRQRDIEPKAKPPHLQTCPFPLCPDCGGPVAANRSNGYINPAMTQCTTCNGIGYVDPPVDDINFGDSPPGSEARVVMFAARYAAGLDLWTGAERPRPQNPEPQHVMDGIVSKVFRNRRGAA